MLRLYGNNRMDVLLAVCFKGKCSFRMQSLKINPNSLASSNLCTPLPNHAIILIKYLPIVSESMKSSPFHSNPTSIPK